MLKWLPGAMEEIYSALDWSGLEAALSNDNTIKNATKTCAIADEHIIRGSAAYWLAHR